MLGFERFAQSKEREVIGVQKIKICNLELFNNKSNNMHALIYNISKRSLLCCNGKLITSYQQVMNKLWYGLP